MTRAACPIPRILAALVGLTLAAAAPAQRSPIQRMIDLKLPDVEAIDGEAVRQVLPADAIPAIDKPRFASAAEADRFLDDAEPVVGVVHNGEAKAYSLWHLDRHEVVNDQLGSDPVAVTW